MNEKAVAVAKDVIKHLNALKLRHAVYMYGEIPILEGDLQKNVEIVQKHCDVCLLGACLLSKARLYDEIDMKEVVDPHNNQQIWMTDVRQLLGDIFDLEQMDLMEAAFEMTTGLAEDCKDEELLEKAARFGEQYKNKDERVRAVMENIIANNGKFIVNAEVTV